VVRAALGQREDDDGTTCPIGAADARAARRQGARVMTLSLVIGIALAAAAWLVAGA
jgi:hypothetical protein